jgi:hypothetical protein
LALNQTEPWSDQVAKLTSIRAFQNCTCVLPKTGYLKLQILVQPSGTASMTTPIRAGR